MADWSDYESLRQQIRYNTVDKLKHIVAGLNEQCHAGLSRTGRKQDLIDRIMTKMDEWRAAGRLETWDKVRGVLAQVRENRSYHRSSMTSMSPPSPSYQPLATPSGPQSMNAHAFRNGVGKIRVPVANPYSNSGEGSSSGLPRYDPYAPPKPMPSNGPPSALPKLPSIRFKPSPFIRIEQSVSTVVECPESTGTMDRRSQTLSFTLTPEQATKLESNPSRLQLRLYCTSSAFYTNSPTAFRSSAAPCPVEFPATCEVRLNGTALTANLKGLKKKPGTAPPAELPRESLKTGSTQLNKIEMVYVNSQQPIMPRKYYMIVFLVEVTSVEQLVARLVKSKYTAKEEVKSTMVEGAEADDDIIAGPQKMSLKCPLSYVRISTPCRSIQCVHPQCFDATSWYSMMEQTTTWLCPVCEKVLNPDDLMVDGYFDDILKTTNDGVEDVMVEADGEWHTTDNKFASAGWRHKHPYTPRNHNSQTSGRHSVKTEGQSKSWPNVTPLLVDSDSDDEEHFVKTALSPSAASPPDTNAPSNYSESRTAANVIDLTLDSDDEDQARPPPPSPPSAAYPKRKRSEDDGYGDGHDSRRQRTVPGAPSMSRMNGTNPSPFTTHR
ncbi:hypothetical protein SISSUDRAFT_1048528 [Sistotremastrum suecicum HHB10207 ss-3]|uniref:Zf-MIZ-domain-containing protein n=1 Tax=Sistotremastrum suecicum HHB10207 ss-3 TaxID=1314776 RepID=A0A166CGE4_9AGAM|nr:hypothetical protein SISSUDRAFT_1048528 [Sistotremastrum suecicum HHB10207 ss-3]